MCDQHVQLLGVAKQRPANGCTNEHEAHLRRDGPVAPVSESTNFSEVPTHGVPRHEGLDARDVQAGHSGTAHGGLRGVGLRVRLPQGLLLFGVGSPVFCCESVACAECSGGLHAMLRVATC